MKNTLPSLPSLSESDFESWASPTCSSSSQNFDFRRAFRSSRPAFYPNLLIMATTSESDGESGIEVDYPGQDRDSFFSSPRVTRSPNQADKFFPHPPRQRPPGCSGRSSHRESRKQPQQRPDCDLALSGPGGLCSLQESGSPNTASYALHFLDRNGCPLSPLHTLPLHASDSLLHFICKTPRGEWSELECGGQEGDPDASPARDGSGRLIGSSASKFGELEGVIGKRKGCGRGGFQPKFSKGQPARYAGNTLWNIGMLPQTWANPELPNLEYGGIPYDGRPVEVLDLGGRTATVGEMYAIKPLAAFAVIEFDLVSGAPELAWKVVGVRAEDINALELEDVADVARRFPGVLEEIREWLRVCHCIEQGDQTAVFGLNERAAGKDEALTVIQEAHANWQLLVNRFPYLTAPLPGPSPSNGTSEVASKQGWSDGGDGPLESPRSDAMGSSGHHAGASSFSRVAKPVRARSTRPGPPIVAGGIRPRDDLLMKPQQQYGASKDPMGGAPGGGAVPPRGGSSYNNLPVPSFTGSLSLEDEKHILQALRRKQVEEEEDENGEQREALDLPPPKEETSKWVATGHSGMRNGDAPPFRRPPGLFNHSADPRRGGFAAPPLPGGPLDQNLRISRMNSLTISEISEGPYGAEGYYGSESEAAYQSEWESADGGNGSPRSVVSAPGRGSSTFGNSWQQQQMPHHHERPPPVSAGLGGRRSRINEGGDLPGRGPRMSSHGLGSAGYRQANNSLSGESDVESVRSEDRRTRPQHPRNLQHSAADRSSYFASPPSSGAQSAVNHDLTRYGLAAKPPSRADAASRRSAMPSARERHAELRSPANLSDGGREGQWERDSNASAGVRHSRHSRLDIPPTPDEDWNAGGAASHTQGLTPTSGAGIARRKPPSPRLLQNHHSVSPLSPTTSRPHGSSSSQTTPRGGSSVTGHVQEIASQLDATDQMHARFNSRLAETKFLLARLKAHSANFAKDPTGTL
eukprot:TRINITY_DN26214_c0_g1_i1.p1 TRINITY_DN26214_c0_g1~~TRINITY_DN26214_c0_g1_i1.p1  ORF type:complete len:979 (-),score=110.05 TRINITY_DN26214_c0_g1_i1:19-2955(-)